MIAEQQTPTLEKPEALGELLSNEPLIDNSSEFDFPFHLSSLPRLLSFSLEDSNTVHLAKRTVTEGRAYSLPTVIFSRALKDQTITYHDLTVKGGGSEVKPNTNLYVNTGTEHFPKYDASSPVPVTVQVAGKTIQVRYHSQELFPLTSYLGVHAYNSGMADHYMSLYLEERDLRTRSLVAAWELNDDTKMATPNGIITASDFKKETGVMPGLEIWASRCKYRVQDILRFVYEMEHASELKDKTIKISAIGVPRRDYDAKRDLPNHKPSETDFDIKTREQTITELVVLANEIKLRAANDNDEAFLELAQTFQDEITLENVGEFYLAYLERFGQVLGKQFAILEKNSALFGMFNLQNITLLAEIVDHDTTMIEGNVMDEKGDLVPVSAKRFRRFTRGNNERMTFEEQLFVGYDSVMSMILALGRAGVIDAGEETYKQLRQVFLKSYLSEFSKKRQSLLYRHAYMNIADIEKDDSSENHDPYSEHISQSFNEDVFSLTAWAGWDQSLSPDEALEIEPKAVNSNDAVEAIDEKMQRFVSFYIDKVMNPEASFDNLVDDRSMITSVLGLIEKNEALSEYSIDDIRKKLINLGVLSS